MSPDEERVLEGVIAAFRARRHIFTEHAAEQIVDRELDADDVEEGVRADAPEVIEDYPGDPRGPSCLVLCQGPGGLSYHVLVTYPPVVRVITVYEPGRDRWAPDLRRRLR